MSNSLSKNYYVKDEKIYHLPIRTTLPIQQINHQIAEKRKLKLLEVISCKANNNC